MSWFTDDWRLKLLALGLAVLMLGAIAFAQNPVTTHTFHPPVSYTLPPNLVILNPQRTVAVTVQGLADSVSAMTDNSLIATVDGSKASPGAAVKLTIAIQSLAPVTVLNPAVPIALRIDTRATEELSVQVITHPVAGWSVTSAVAHCGSTQPCLVHFDGPLSWEKAANLTATVNYTPSISATSYTSDNWPIQLRNSNGILDIATCSTSPPCGLDVTNVSVEVHAVSGSTSNTVVLVDAPPSHGPPPGYRITGISISPATVVITGAPVELAKIPRIVLPGVDLSSSTSTATFTVNIPLPDGINLIGPTTQAKITYTIEKNPSVNPSPS